MRNSSSCSSRCPQGPGGYGTDASHSLRCRGLTAPGPVSPQHAAPGCLRFLAVGRAARLPSRAGGGCSGPAEAAPGAAVRRGPRKSSLPARGALRGPGPLRPGRDQVGRGGAGGTGAMRAAGRSHARGAGAAARPGQGTAGRAGVHRPGAERPLVPQRLGPGRREELGERPGPGRASRRVSGYPHGPAASQ